MRDTPTEAWPQSKHGRRMPRQSTNTRASPSRVKRRTGRRSSPAIWLETFPAALLILDSSSNSKGTRLRRWKSFRKKFSTGGVSQISGGFGNHVRFLVEQRSENRFEACGPLLLASFTAFKLNPAFIKAIQHLYSRQRVLHSLRAEKSLPGIARHNLRSDRAAQNFCKRGSDLIFVHISHDRANWLPCGEQGTSDCPSYLASDSSNCVHNSVPFLLSFRCHRTLHSI